MSNQSIIMIFFSLVIKTIVDEELQYQQQILSTDWHKE